MLRVIDASRAARQLSTMVAVTDREREILSAVVSEYSTTGEPVASRTLAERYAIELSPATIRAVFVELENKGFLHQPHASAGRVPTERAFRLFIDALMRVRQVSRKDSARIATHFDELAPGADILRESGRLLSEMTKAAAVVVRPRLESRKLTNLRFVATRPGQLLAVLIFADSSIENRFIPSERVFSSSELERVHNLLDAVILGHTLDEVRQIFVRSVNEQRDELRGLYGVGASLVGATIEAKKSVSDMIIEGQASLLESPHLQSVEHMKDLMRALEEREHLVGLIDQVLLTDSPEAEPHVLLGEETSAKVGYPLSVVATPFSEAGNQRGAVAVVGPTPMDYPSVVGLVRAVARAMSAALAKSR